MKLVNSICIVVALSFSLSANADEDVEQNIQKGLVGILPDLEITRISKTPINNLYEVLIGPEVIYMTGDGRYAIKGDLIDMPLRRNLSEEQRSTARMEIFKKLPPDEIIEFSPKETKHVVYVFTDVDCSYCRRLHRDVPVLNENGISVRYLAYPRAGIGSQGHSEMDAVWCAEDRQQALTDAKNGKQIVSNKCPSPVEKQYTLGRKLGIRGTPAIFLEDGAELPGYVPPETLLKYVNQ